MPPSLTVTFSTADVSRHTGATLRQLQYWDEQGHVKAQRALSDGTIPPKPWKGIGGSGRARAYDRDDLLRVAFLVQLTAKGVQIRRLRRWLKDVEVSLDDFIGVSPGGTIWGTPVQVAEWAADDLGPVRIIRLPDEVRRRLHVLLS